MPHDPRAADRDAGLRAHRRGALGGVRRLLRGVARGPHQRRRVQGADHRRRRLAQGRQVVPLKDSADEALEPTPVDRARARRAPHRARRRPGPRAAIAGGTTLDAAAPTTGASPSGSTPRTCCSSSTPRAPPASPKGIVHTTRRLPARRASSRTSCVFDLRDDDVYWCTADIGWVTGHSYVVYGPLANGATGVMYEGAPEHPGAGPLLGDHRAAQGHHLLHGADGDPRVREALATSISRSTTSRRCACSARVGEPINPEAWMWYHERIGGGRCPIVDTWWQTETGAIMISPLPGVTRDEARLGHACRCPASRPTIVDEQGDDGAARRRRLPRAQAARGRRCCARSTATTSATSKTYWERFGPRVYFTGDGAQDATRTATSGSWAASTTCSTSPATALDDRDRVARWSRTPRSPRPPWSARHDELKGERHRALRDHDAAASSAERRPAPGAARARGATRSARSRGPTLLLFTDRPAEDALRQDHAPAAQGHRRGPRARRRDDAARSRRSSRRSRSRPTSSSGAPRSDGRRPRARARRPRRAASRRRRAPRRRLRRDRRPTSSAARAPDGRRADLRRARRARP